ncbi:hypothetical protein BDC45DRAFT_571108 [Circinella umbellata]|nr:hypothetical protein BDC45DRAFT_571102 [Circinella umbellata]KAI7852513.1 hypothetical protein BDC45DRAFT_571108 [Circinella umbellata]
MSIVSDWVILAKSFGDELDLYKSLTGVQDYFKNANKTRKSPALGNFVKENTPFLVAKTELGEAFQSVWKTRFHTVAKELNLTIIGPKLVTDSFTASPMKCQYLMDLHHTTNEEGQLNRKIIGTKVDLVMKQGNLEYGCLEAGCPDDPGNTKAIPRTLKDILSHLTK